MNDAVRGRRATVANAAKDNDVPLVLPTRIISYAWGQGYVDELLSLTLPALLAPGNLPYVAARVPAEIVLLTEERFFAQVDVHPTTARLRQHCPVRLLALDDLIAASKDGYGMALTYVLHRSFCDLGAAMTDAWQIFLNADFILADGSLRTVLGHLQRGERIVAAPSYCVVAGEVKPLLRDRVEERGGILAMNPREMARLALRHRHNTIRGKSLNQSEFHIYFMDQFYWLFDEDTLLGRQLPIAIVGMRPERHVAEPSAFWDHGLMEEFCPDAAVKVIGDSDEFLMIELRGSDVAEEQIRTGWPTAHDLAERMITWMTPYQRSFAQHPLVLHAGDIPTDTDAADGQLAAFVGEVVSGLPEFLPSHRDHPQWLYHSANFVRARHEFLSARLSMATTRDPPDSLFEVDRIWWRLDGARKKLAERRAELEREERALSEAVAEIDKRTVRELTTATHHYLGRAGSPEGPEALDDYRPEALDDYRKASAAIHEKHRSCMAKLQPAIDRAAAQNRQRVGALDQELGELLRKLEERYEQAIARRVRSAAVPVVRTRQGPIIRNIGSASGPVRLARRVYGQWPRVRSISPFWVGLRHLITIVDEAVARGAKDALIIGEPSGVASSIANVPGRQVQVSLAGLQTGNLTKAFASPPLFDLCVVDLDVDSIVNIREIFAAVWPFVGDGGTLVGLCANFTGSTLEIDEGRLFAQLRGFLSLRLQYAGSIQSATAIRSFEAARAALERRNPLGLGRALFALAAAFIGVRSANRNESGNPEGARIPDSGYTSVTISASQASARDT